MSNKKHFQSDNNKHSKLVSRVDTRNPEFNSSINAIGEKESKGFDANLNKWVDFVQWSR